MIDTYPARTRPESQHQSEGKFESRAVVGDLLHCFLDQAVGVPGHESGGVIKQAGLQVMALGQESQDGHEEKDHRQQR